MFPEASLRVWMPAIHAGMTKFAFFSVGERKIMDHFAVSYLQSCDACLLLLSAPLLSFLFFHGDGRHFELGIRIAQHPHLTLRKGKTHSRRIHGVVDSHGEIAVDLLRVGIFRPGAQFEIDGTVSVAHEKA